MNCVCNAVELNVSSMPLLSCHKCGHRYHQKCIPNLANFASLLLGDPFFHFECSKCNNGGHPLIQKISTTVRERLQLVIFNLIHNNAGQKLTDGSMVFQKAVIYDALEQNWLYMTGNTSIAGERGSIMTTLSQQLTKRVEGLMSLPEHPLPMCSFDGTSRKGNSNRLVIYDVASDGSVQPAHSTVLDGGVSSFGTYPPEPKKRKADPDLAGSPTVKSTKRSASKAAVAPPPVLPNDPSHEELLAHIESLNAHYCNQIHLLETQKRHINDSGSNPAWRILKDVSGESNVLENVLRERDDALGMAEKAQQMAEDALTKLAALQKSAAVEQRAASGRKMQSRLPTPVTQKSESNSQSKSEPRFKSSHHLILQRKPRSKKRVALIMAQHKLQQKPQQEMADTAADAVSIENLEDDESLTSAQTQPQIASLQNPTTEKHVETLGKLEPDVLEPFETLESSASNEPHQPLLAYANHSFVAVESQAISEVTANGISTSVIKVLNSLGGWLAGDVTSKDCNDTEGKLITTESLAVNDTLTPSQYDLAPSMVANFEIALARSSTPAARPFGNMSNLPPKLKEKVAPQQQHQQPLKPVLLNSSRGPSTHKYTLVAPPQHYPFMRNLNPSIPTIIKHHSEGSQKFVTDAFTLINSNQIQLQQQLRNVATPLEQKYSDKKSNIPRPDLIFPILPLPQPAQGLKIQPPKSPKPLEPISNGSQARSRVATPIVSRTLNGSLKLPLTSSDGTHQTTSIQHAETLPQRLYSLHQITKWDSEKDLPIIEHETEADLQTAAGSGKYFHNGEGTKSTAPPFAVQHATAVVHGSYAKEWRPLVDSNKKLKKSVLQPKPAGFLPSLEQSAQSNLVGTFKKSESCTYSVDDSKSDSLHLQQTFTHESTPAIPSKRHPLAPAPHLEVSNSHMPRSDSNNENPPQSHKARRFHLPKLNPKSLLLEPVATRTDPALTSSTSPQEQQDQNHLAAAVIRGPYSSQLAVKNSTKTWKYSSPSSASPTLRPSSSFTQTTSVSKLSMLCASIAGTESRGLLGFDRENEHYLEKKKKAERLKTYAGHVRMLANLRTSHHNRFGVMQSKDRGECGSNSGDSLLQVGADKTNMSRFGDFGKDKKDPALEKREKMISYARTIKKPTMSKAAGISMVGKESGGQYPKSLPPLECNDSGVDLDSMAAMHERSMQVVESIKREMGLC
ncbi:hypothetical protein HDU77_009073 [Chytriomyces hyalinus]|nr:hypothetical protein HDU77_009073 [Chytriomyces hyalinus]